MKVPLYLKKMSFTILKQQAKHHLEGANIHSTFLRRPYKNNRFQFSNKINNVKHHR